MQALKVNIKNDPHKVSILNKIFVFSILFEPLTYFVLVPQHFSGIGANISRLFQLFVLIGLLFNVLLTGKFRLFNPFSKLNKSFSYFFIYAIIVGIFGYIFGSYTLHIGDALEISFDNIFSEVTNSYYFRPTFEYFISLYYFVYFVILMQYMLKNKADIDYFFRWFVYIFIALLVIGFGDLIIQHLSGYAYEGLGRSLADDENPGDRFHSLIGEPRDAFVYLTLSLGILTLRGVWDNNKNLNIFWIVIVLCALYLTQSFSGVLGIIFTIVLLIYFYIPTLTFKKLLLFILLLVIAIFLIYINVKYSLRMMKYIDGFISLYQTLDAGDEITTQLRPARNNIYPLWSLWLEMRENNFMHLFFGNGLGSASVVNNFYMKETGVINPNSSIIRMLYETGIIGCTLFLYAFISPIKLMYKGHRIYTNILFFTLLIFGTYLGHRSVAPFIFLGAAMLVFSNKEK